MCYVGIFAHNNNNGDCAMKIRTSELKVLDIMNEVASDAVCDWSAGTWAEDDIELQERLFVTCGEKLFGGIPEEIDADDDSSDGIRKALREVADYAAAKDEYDSSVLNKRLNSAMRNKYSSWQNYEWSKFKDENGAYWYTCKRPAVGLVGYVNFIEGETGELVGPLDRDDAFLQWYGLDEVSLDNGEHYRPVEELDDDEIRRVIDDIRRHDSKTYPEYANACVMIDDCHDDECEWLQDFLHLIGQQYIIG